MLQKFTSITRNREEFRTHCQNLIPLMQPDVSRYAPGRYRLWLFHEAILSRKTIKPAHFDERLWNFCQRVYPGSNIALLTFNGSTETIKSNGIINAHRDDTYAQDKAVGINLGSATFGYNSDRRSTDTTALTPHQLNDGDIYSFHCKHLHAVLAAEEGRMSLNIWKLKEDTRYPWCKPCNPEILDLLF